MSVPNAALDSLLDNLSHILTREYLVGDLRDNIQALHNELQALKGPLDAYQDSDRLQELAREIRSVVDQAEDAVDSYLVQTAVQKSRVFFFKAFHQMTHYPRVLRNIGEMIKRIRDEVEKINQKTSSFGVSQSQGDLSVHPLGKPKEAPIVEEEHVVGFEAAAEEVITHLVEGPIQLEVISIVGMLGLGKTTLARKVFSDPDVDYEYMIRVFVYVSKEYEKRNVLLKILGCFMQVSDEVREMTVEMLEKYLYQQLEGKQYLVVLDDVWEVEDWELLKGAFPNNKKRCRVLITTRNLRVAKHANPRIPPFMLNFLPLDKSLELLHWWVFGENNCPMELQEYKLRIAEKCDGLPLAIVVIAGILWNRRDRPEWWKHVANNVKDYIARDQEQTSKVIELMYKHLPNCLKPCFLYLGVFREYYEIPVWKLVRLWIAEGLIKQEGDANLEDVAENYLEDLVYRNLVMVGQKRSNAKIKTCLLQTTIREFCKKQAMEENLFQEIKKNQLSLFLSGNPTLDQYRRLCINNDNILDYLSGKPSAKCVRSLLTCVREETLVEPKFVSCIPKTFKLLRVLEVQSLIFTRFPMDLCSLVLLKYLAVSFHISRIPSALSALWNMQTLIVNTTYPTLEIRADIWKMPQFRHLHTNASTILPCSDAKNQDEDFEGKNIQTLSTIQPESCQKEVFRRTRKLKKLGIRGRLSKLFEFHDGESSLFDNIRKLDLLENLKLLNDEESHGLNRLPSEKSFPPQLKALTLSNAKLDWKEISTLGNLGNLEVLKLKNYAFQGKFWHTEKGGFRCLKTLHIGRSDLAIWEASEDSFPKLESLELNSCDKLQGVPHALADIPSLQLLVLHCTNTLVASSARKLQVLKLAQARKGNKSNCFKLSVYPPEH